MIDDETLSHFLPLYVSFNPSHPHALCQCNLVYFTIFLILILMNYLAWVFYYCFALNNLRRDSLLEEVH